MDLNGTPQIPPDSAVLQLFFETVNGICDRVLSEAQEATNSSTIDDIVDEHAATDQRGPARQLPTQ